MFAGHVSQRGAVFVKSEIEKSFKIIY